MVNGNYTTYIHSPMLPTSIKTSFFFREIRPKLSKVCPYTSVGASIHSELQLARKVSRTLYIGLNIKTYKCGRGMTLRRSWKFTCRNYAQEQMSVPNLHPRKAYYEWTQKFRHLKRPH